MQAKDATAGLQTDDNTSTIALMAEPTARGIVLIISGPPGAGKSTVAKEIASSSSKFAALVEGDTFWKHFSTSCTAPIGVRFKALVTAAIAAAMSYAMHGIDTILDFSVPPWMMDSATKMAKARGVKLAYIILLPNKIVCASRVAARQGLAVEDYSKWAEFHDEFNAPQVERYVLPCSLSGASTSDIAAAVVSSVDSHYIA